MYLKNITRNEISICEKDLCLTIKGNSAKIAGTVIATAFALYALFALLKS